MEFLREYFLSIVAVCMIVFIATVMVKSAMVGKVVRFAGGILILLVVISPLVKVDFKSVTEAMKQETYSDTQKFSDVQQRTQENLLNQIRTATEEYIETMAEQMGLTVQASITLSDEQIPQPIAVELVAPLRPEEMLKLSNFIETNIGIRKENQRWRDYDS